MFNKTMKTISNLFSLNKLILSFKFNRPYEQRSMHFINQSLQKTVSKHFPSELISMKQSCLWFLKHFRSWLNNQIAQKILFNTLLTIYQPITPNKKRAFDGNDTLIMTYFLFLQSQKYCSSIKNHKYTYKLSKY